MEIIKELEQVKLCARIEVEQGGVTTGIEEYQVFSGLKCYEYKDDFKCLAANLGLATRDLTTHSARLGAAAVRVKTSTNMDFVKFVGE